MLYEKKKETPEEAKERHETLEFLRHEVDRAFIDVFGKAPKALSGDEADKLFIKLHHSSHMHMKEKKRTSTEKSDLIRNMTTEEFREKAIAELMNTYGYSREKAEETVNAPY